MLELFRLDHELTFPSVNLALDEPNGLLAFGGDLSPERLLHAYSQGIFPWFSEGEPLLWWSPDPRGIISTEDFYPSKSLLKSIRKNGYTATMDREFEAVLKHCAKVPRAKIQIEDEQHNNSTWITDEMIDAYKRLHKIGWAHSIEIWDAQTNLVGGLYGVAINGGFCGESMFHLKTDASKAAFYALVLHMRRHSLNFIDCQMVNPHLETLGCFEVPRTEFIAMWHRAIRQIVSDTCWTQQAVEFT